MPDKKDIAHAVSEAVAEAAEHSPIAPAAQPDVILEIAESKYRRLGHTEVEDWLELRINLAVEVEDQTGGSVSVDALK